MKIINVLQLSKGSFLNLDSFPVYYENNNEVRFQVERFCESLLIENNYGKNSNFDDYFDPKTDFFEDLDNDYQILIVNTYIDE